MPIKYDVVLKNGVILDGSGNPWFKTDICVNNRRIEHIDQLNSAVNAKLEIDVHIYVPSKIARGIRASGRRTYQ